MKLRYYLRGLGIGIFVTALIMGASGQKAAPLTDAEIKAKAATLGMIESDARKLTDNVPTVSPAEKLSDAAADSSGDKASDAAADSSGEKASDAAAGSSGEKASDAAAENSAEKPSTVTVIIESGSGSGVVSGQLQELGLVESAAEFDRYLIDHGYSKRISVGIYEIMSGTSEEEIAKIITKTQ